MKSTVVALVLLFSFFSAHAGSTICAGPTLYYSYLQTDLGIQPLPGTKIGSETIVSNGQVLLNEEFFAGDGQFKIFPFSVTIMKDGDVVDSTGSQAQGSEISKTTAVLYNVDPYHPNKKTEVYREDVVCTVKWSMAL